MRDSRLVDARIVHKDFCNDFDDDCDTSDFKPAFLVAAAAAKTGNGGTAAAATTQGKK